MHLSLKPVYDAPASQTRRISAHMVRQRFLNNPHWTQKTHKKPTYDKGLQTRIETSLQLIRALIEIRLHFTSKPNSRLRPFPNASPAFATAGGRRINGGDPITTYPSPGMILQVKWFWPVCLRMDRNWSLDAKFKTIKKQRSTQWLVHLFGQIIATSHDLGPQKVAKEGTSPYFRQI